jgi:putative hydrolase of the HAD superfamily
MTRRWIFLDAVGTLLRVRGSVGAQYARAARLFGASPDPRAINEAFQYHFARTPPLGAGPRIGAGGQVSDRLLTRTAEGESAAEAEFRWWKDLMWHIFSGMGLPFRLEPYFEHVFWMFASAACWDLYPETAAVLKGLVEADWAIGLVSNFDFRLRPLLYDLRLAPWISQVTLPSLAGAAKPDAAIFLSACAEAGVTPSAAWHIGDSMTDDYQGARQAGLQAILLDRTDRHLDFSGPKIKRLSQIFDILEKNA